MVRYRIKERTESGVRSFFARYLFFILLVFGFCDTAVAISDAEIEAHLKAFHAQPRIIMDQVPLKKSLTPLTSMNAQQVGWPQKQKNGSIEQKRHLQNYLWKRSPSADVFKRRALSTFSDFTPKTEKLLISEFLGKPDFIADIHEIDRLQLKNMRIQRQPWSGFYWPIYLGGLAYPFGDPLFPRSFDWKKNEEFVLNRRLEKQIHERSELLSPAEKYDRLIGDHQQKTMTRFMWEEGRKLYEQNKKIGYWIGFCHGWAPASFMLPRPVRSVSAVSFGGFGRIKFYPSDIKALASLLWANSRPAIQVLGGRCRVQDPEKDENGRVIMDECFDVNPGLWHILLVNSLKNEMPFIFDATFDHEVWNHPIVSYSMTYFNPETARTSSSLSNAMIPISEFQKDKFKKYRSSGAIQVVGVALQLHFIAEAGPFAKEFETQADDKVKEVTYYYDLEITERGEIIGGEWYTNLHPDFLWTPRRDSRAVTSEDVNIQERWSAGRPIPSIWREGAIRAAARGQPLAKIVEQLVQWSQPSELDSR